MSSTSKGNGLISRAVREALCTLVSPPICEQVIRRSLRAHALGEIPEQGPEVSDWLNASLKPALEDAVGSDAAELLIAQLAPMAAYAALNHAQVRSAIGRRVTPTPSRGNAALASLDPPYRQGHDQADERPTRSTNVGFSSSFEIKPSSGSDPSLPFRLFEEEAPSGIFEGTERITLACEPDNANEFARMAARTLPPPSSHDISYDETARNALGNTSKLRRESEFVSLPVVLAATLNQERLSALELYLEGTAAVTMVGDLAGLLDALAQPSRCERLLLLDCMEPSVHVDSVAALRQDLPIGITVVVWGVDEARWNALERDKSVGSRWVRCSHEASTDDVGSLCSMLLG